MAKKKDTNPKRGPLADVRPRTAEELGEAMYQFIQRQATEGVAFLRDITGVERRLLSRRRS